MAQIRGELQREKFIKSISFDDQQINNTRIAVPIGNEEIDDIIMEPPELNIDDDDIDEESDNESDNGNNNETDEFIKLWFERLNEEDTNVDDISDDEIDEDSSELNELLRRRIHPADNDDAKWDLTTLFKTELIAPNFFFNMPS